MRKSIPFATLFIAAISLLTQHVDAGERTVGAGAIGGGLSVTPSGGVALSVPLSFPAARGGVPIPLRVVHDGSARAGELGVGWSIPFTYVEKNTTFDHTRPKYFVDPSHAPEPLDRVYLSLDGAKMLMVPVDNAGTYRPMVGPQTMTLVDRGSLGWRLFDGSGHTFDMTRLPQLKDRGLWFLTEVNDATNKNAVRLAYSLDKVAVGDGSAYADEIELTDIDYNYSADGCAKNRIELGYTFWRLRPPSDENDPSLPPSSEEKTGIPFALWPEGGGLRVRTRLLRRIDILAHGDTCGTSDQRVRLRGYRFSYHWDSDTGAPRLVASDLVGRQGTAEESQRLPIGRYAYGSAETSGTLKMTQTQTMAAQPNLSTQYRDALGVTLTRHTSSGQDSLVSTIQSLVDMNGDGRADLVFNDASGKEFIATGKNAATGAAGPAATELSATSVPLTTDVLSASVSRENKFRFGDRLGIQDTKIQLIDFNGDGRLDILKADDPDYWTLELNIPATAVDPSASPGAIQWSERKISVTGLREELNRRGLLYDPNGIIPLSRTFTGLQVDYTLTRVADDGSTVPQKISAVSIDSCQVTGRAFTAWELRDVNGDGYPDFVSTELPIQRVRHSERADDCNADQQRQQRGGCPYDYVSQKYVCVCHDRYDLGFTEAPDHPTVGGDSIWFRPSPDASRLMVDLNRAGTLLSAMSNPFDPVQVLGGATGPVEQWNTEIGLRTTGRADLARGDRTQYATVTYGDPAPEGKLVWQSQACESEGVRGTRMSKGLVDVTGDGIPERVWLDGDEAMAGIGTGLGYRGRLLLPGLTGVGTDRYEQCKPDDAGNPAPSDTPVEITQDLGYVDITGDGIPDYVDGNSVQPGTGAGWGPPIALDSPSPSWKSMTTCAGSVSKVVSMTTDVDGDGRPDIVRVGDDGKIQVWRLGDASGVGAYDAGRLVSVSNGYGAQTRVDWESAKNDVYATHRGRGPEIVVSQTTTSTPDQTYAPTLYAFGGSDTHFDAAADRFVSTGFSLRATLTGTRLRDGRILTGVARVVDLLAPSDASTPYQAYVLTGLPQSIHLFDGQIIADPWRLLQYRPLGGEHGGVLNEYTTHSRSLAQFDCVQSIAGYVPMILIGINGRYDRPCTTTGYAYPNYTEAWRGDSVSNGKSVMTARKIDRVDDLGRALEITHFGDLKDPTDDVCEQIEYASSGPYRINDAVSTRTLGECHRSGNRIYSRVEFSYDEPTAPPGSVIEGNPTTVTSHVYETAGGNEQSQLVTKIEYDGWGNAIRREQDAGTESRVVTLGDWDAFRLVPHQLITSASDVAATFATTTKLDPFSLAPLQVTGPSGATSTYDRDGFGRRVAVGVIPAGENTEILLGQTSYTGFEVGANLERQVEHDSYQTALGEMTSSTTFLDALGRPVRSMQWLGDDYNDTVVTRDVRFDGFGRPKFAADPYPAANPGSAPYGTTYYYKTDGSLDCSIRASGEAGLVRQPDEDAEVFPTCFERTYTDWREVRRVKGPNELASTGPQAGAWSEELVGATGRVHERSRWYAGQRKELARFSYDALGSLTKLQRYGEPGVAGKPVTWSFVRDSAGRALVVSEPSAAPRFNNYDAWGNLTSTNWEDPNGAYEVRYEHDALGRLLSEGEYVNNVLRPGTEQEYKYDDQVLPGYGNVTGRLAASYLYEHDPINASRGRSPIMRVVYGYDDLGRVNAVSRLGEEGQEYREHYDYRLDGQLARATYTVPDAANAPESAVYQYDSAGRLDGVSWEENGTSQDLFQADKIDLFGRYQHVVYGNGVEERNYYKATNRRELASTYMVTPNGEERSTSYTRYSPDLRVLERMETSKGAQGTTVNTWSYQYDSLYQLRDARKDNTFGSMMSEDTFDYDGLGNMRTVDDVLGSVDSSITMRGDDPDRVCRTEAEPSSTGGGSSTGTPVVSHAPGSVIMPSAGPARIWLEAETGRMSAPMAFATDRNASLGAYIQVPAKSRNAVGSATFDVKVPTSGTYYLWLRVRAASTANDSYTLRLNGTSVSWDAGAASSWTWKRVNSYSGPFYRPTPFQLTEGRTQLYVGAREDGVQVDRILITTDPSTNPSRIGDTARPLNVVVEAESGVQQAPWGVEIDGATSAGAYLEVPKGQDNHFDSPGKAPTATVSVTVPNDGYYSIWARVRAPDGHTNSFFVRVDHQAWWTWHVPISTRWQTRRVYNNDGSSNQPVVVWLRSGDHTITLAEREAGTAIDTIIVSNQFGTDTPSYSQAPAPDDCQYRYDAQGNVVTIASSQNPTRNFEYDLHGRVTSLVSGAAIARYRYGPEGEVMSYVQGGTGAKNRSEVHYGPFTKSYFTINNNESVPLVEIRIPGVPIIRRGTGPTATVLYGHVQGPGVRRVTDQTGAITQEVEYRAYGGIVEDTGLPGGIGSVQDGFGSGDHLEAFGVVHMGARLYDPRTGRFLQRDPLIIPRTTTMMNPYAFAWNDPVNFSDPSGMDPLLSITKWLFGHSMESGAFNTAVGAYVLADQLLGALGFKTPAQLFWDAIVSMQAGSEGAAFAPGSVIQVSGTAPDRAIGEVVDFDAQNQELDGLIRDIERKNYESAIAAADAKEHLRQWNVFRAYMGGALHMIGAFAKNEVLTVVTAGTFGLLAPVSSTIAPGDLIFVGGSEAGTASAGMEAATIEATTTGADYASETGGVSGAGADGLAAEGELSRIARIAPGSLPPAEENAVLDTLEHIDSGTKPVGALAKKWGVKFKNWAGDLPGPQGANSPYLEYRVAPPPGTTGAGPLRIVTNPETGDMFYTWTHYGDSGHPAFVQIR